MRTLHIIMSADFVANWYRVMRDDFSLTATACANLAQANGIARSINSTGNIVTAKAVSVEALTDVANILDRVTADIV